jgi:hypothetical protein
MMCRSVFVALALLVVAGRAPAQPSGPLVFPVDPIQLLLNLMGTNAAFTATAQVSGEGPKDPDNFYMDVTYCMLGEQLRTVTDLAKLRSRNACDIAQGRLQEMGMDETIMIVLPSLKASFVVYPRARASIEMPRTWREDLKKIVEIQKKRIGEATVNGHPCVAYELHVTNAVGDENDVMIWEATDLKNFPIQMRFDMSPLVFKINFLTVNLEPPDLDLFHPPLDYYRYGSLPELIRARRVLATTPE